MAKQTINTERVATSVSKLKTVDGDINRAFSTMEKAAKRLESDWTGQAATAAVDLKNQIFQRNATRSTVLQNYIRILEQQVNPGYLGAEETNTKLADQFK